MRWHTCDDLDQVDARLPGASQCFLRRHHADLLATIIDNAHLGNANLPIRTRTGWHKRACIEWASGNGREPP
jgi:hypothetical protein